MEQHNYDEFDELFDFESADSETERGAVGIILRIVLAVTTAGFAYLYGYELLTWAVDEFYARIGTTIIYVLCIDFMAFEWPRLAEKNATTEKQIGIATHGWMVSVGMSVLVTFVFTTLVFSEFVNLDGQLGDLVDLFSWLVGIGAVTFQAVWYMRYENNGVKSVQARQKAASRARRNVSAATIQAQHEKQRLGRTLRGVAQRLPGISQEEADRLADDYFRRNTYGRGDEAPEARKRFARTKRPGGGVEDRPLSRNGYHPEE